MVVRVREIREDEHERAGAITVDAYRALLGSSVEVYEPALRDVASRAKNAVVFVADPDGELCGTVTYVPDDANPFAEFLDPGEAGMRMLAVAPSAQGRGIGRALTEACIERAHAEDRSALVLHTHPEMAAAHTIYESLGFRPDPGRDFSPVDGIHLHAFVLPLRKARGSVLRVVAGKAVSAPRERVWDALCDADRWGEWVDLTESYLWMSGPCGPGMRYAERTRLGPLRLRTRWEVTDFDPPHRQVHRSRILGADVRLVISLERSGEVGTFVWFSTSARLPIPGAARLATPLRRRLRDGLERTVEGLGALIEAA